MESADVHDKAEVVILRDALALPVEGDTAIMEQFRKFSKDYHKSYCNKDDSHHGDAEHVMTDSDAAVIGANTFCYSTNLDTDRKSNDNSILVHDFFADLQPKPSLLAFLHNEYKVHHGRGGNRARFESSADADDTGSGHHQLDLATNHNRTNSFDKTIAPSSASVVLPGAGSPESVIRDVMRANRRKSPGAPRRGRGHKASAIMSLVHNINKGIDEQNKNRGPHTARAPDDNQLGIPLHQDVATMPSTARASVTGRQSIPNNDNNNTKANSGNTPSLPSIYAKSDGTSATPKVIYPHPPHTLGLGSVPLNGYNMKMLLDSFPPVVFDKYNNVIPPQYCQHATPNANNHSSKAHKEKMKRLAEEEELRELMKHATTSDDCSLQNIAGDASPEGGSPGAKGGKHPVVIGQGGWSMRRPIPLLRSPRYHKDGAVAAPPRASALQSTRRVIPSFHNRTLLTADGRYREVVEEEGRRQQLQESREPEPPGIKMIPAGDDDSTAAKSEGSSTPRNGAVVARDAGICHITNEHNNNNPYYITSARREALAEQLVHNRTYYFDISERRQRQAAIKDEQSSLQRWLLKTMSAKPFEVCSRYNARVQANETKPPLNDNPDDTLKDEQQKSL